jgi:hypothetical protein
MRRPAVPHGVGGGKGIQRRAKLYPSLVVREIQQIEADLGGRQALVGMLVLAPLNQDLEYFLGLLGDPHNEQKSLAEICALAEILPGELLHKLHASATMLGKVRTAHQVTQGLQPVVADLLRRAAPYEEACHDCMETGSVTPEPTTTNMNPSPGPCETCKGSGRLRYSPDLDRQKLVLELAQTLPKGGGLQITNNQLNLPGGSGGGGLGLLDRVQQIADQALYGLPAAPVDAEVVEADEAPTEDPPADV